MKCGLLGRRLGHSYSPQIHAMLADYEYLLFEKEPEALEGFLRQGDFTGLNVTMPYKQAVIPYLDALTPIASQLGAVNTIVRRDGRLIGHNTDHFGFHALLQRSGISPAGKKCLVLGSGGASQVVQSVLRMYDAHVVVISRSGENHYQNLHRHADAAMIVNTTPVGMYPHTGDCPVRINDFPHLEGVLDVIYNPARTRLLLDAQQRGIVAMNGLYMLVAQAKEAAEWFTGTPIPGEKTEEIYTRLRARMENIVLIGMPGCGKSTVGKAIAERTGRVFVDLDSETEALAQKSIPAIFAEDGEAAFRALETQVIAQYGKESGLVIATGGGCVTRPENLPLLQQNGRIFWLQRQLHHLPTEGRPLSQVQDLGEMYKKRAPLYRRFANHIIDNNQAPAHAVDAILEEMR